MSSPVDAGRWWCNKCDMFTVWAPTRRGAKREKCGGCGTLYPCRHACDHMDCKEARRAVGDR